MDERAKRVYLLQGDACHLSRTPFRLLPIFRSNLCFFCLSYNLNCSTVHVKVLALQLKIRKRRIWSSNFEQRHITINELVESSNCSLGWIERDTDQGNEHGQWAMAARLAFHSHHPFSDFLLLNAINPLHSTTSAGFNTFIVSIMVFNSPYT